MRPPLPTVKEEKAIEQKRECLLNYVFAFMEDNISPFSNAAMDSSLVKICL